jgi:hypothetical protein
MSNFIKIRPLGTDLFHADERTDGWSEKPEARPRAGGNRKSKPEGRMASPALLNVTVF